MSIIELRVALDHVEPHVSRILHVPAGIRLDRLHRTIQAAMGWDNAHLYMFRAGDKTWREPDPYFDGDYLPVDKTSLIELIETTGARSIHYVYDFGDSWEHTIAVGATTAPVAGELYPRLTDIVGRCPPEDVGGFPGYEDFLNAIGDPKHPEHEHLKAWYGGAFDPKLPESDKLRFEVMKLDTRKNLALFSGL